MSRLALGLLFLLSSAAAASADVAEVVARVVSAYGGAAAVRTLRSARTVATVDSAMQGPGEVRRDLQAPDRLRVEIVYRKATEIRILSGDEGWRGDDRKLQKVQGLPRLAMVYQLLRSCPPWALAEYEKLLVDRGTQSREGAEYRVLGLPFPGGLDLAYWIGSDDRVIWIDGALQAGGGQTTFATKYGDFRRTEGALVPYFEQSYAGGQQTGATKVRSIAFAPKDLGPFEPRGARR